MARKLQPICGRKFRASPVDYADPQRSDQPQRVHPSDPRHEALTSGHRAVTCETNTARTLSDHANVPFRASLRTVSPFQQAFPCFTGMVFSCSGPVMPTAAGEFWPQVPPRRYTRMGSSARASDSATTPRDNSGRDERWLREATFPQCGDSSARDAARASRAPAEISVGKQEEEFS